jgi:phage host-nuclease inhibitor protein Gam
MQIFSICIFLFKSVQVILQSFYIQDKERSYGAFILRVIRRIQMKTSKSKSFSTVRLALGVIGMLVVFSMVFAIPSGVAFADSGTPQPDRTPHPDRTPVQRDYSGLIKAFQNDQTLLGKQQDALNKTGDAVTRVQDLITKAQAKGVDTSALSLALATFQAQVATVQSSHSTAASILSNHNGFDGSGNVTDPTAAAQTVKDAGQALRDAHDVLTQAVKDLHSAVTTWLEANKDRMQNDELQKAYQNEQKWLSTQQSNLGKANDMVTKVQDLISKGQGKGLDTSDLSSALSIFQGQLSTSQAADTTAANLLSAHNGFDGSGNVTDQASAAQTVKDANQALKTASDTLKQASQDLGTAVKAWEEANKDKLQDQGLQKTYQNEQNWLGIQTTNLGKANDAIAKVQDLITQAQGKGLDTSALESALATYQSQLATAGVSHAAASNILTAHAGFDGSGNVTDQTAATQTVKDANQALLDAHNVLVQSVNDLHTAVQAWLEANHQSVTPAATPTGL